MRILLITDYQNGFVDTDATRGIDFKLAERIRLYIKNDSKVILLCHSNFSQCNINNKTGNSYNIKSSCDRLDDFKKPWELYGNVGLTSEELEGVSLVWVDKGDGWNDLVRKINAIQKEISNNESRVKSHKTNNLPSDKIDSIEICGLNTHSSVVTAAILSKSSTNNASILINSQLCLDRDEELGERAKEFMGYSGMVIC